MEKKSFSVTRDTSGLFEATGFWSGDSIYFNIETHQFVITNCDISPENINDMIINYLHEKDENNGITRFEKEILSIIDSDRYPFPSIFSVNHTVRAHYSFQHIRRSIKEVLPHPPSLRTSWDDFYLWLKKQKKTPVEQKNYFCELIIETYTNCESSDFAYVTGLRLLLHPWLKFNIARWVEQKLTIDDIICLIANLDLNQELQISRREGPCSPDFFKKVEQLTEGRIAIPETYTPDNKHARVWYKFRLSMQMLLGILFARGYLMFPPVYVSKECWHANDIIRSRVYQMWPENWKWGRTDHETLAYRLISASTLRTLHDIPQNIRELITAAYGPYYKYTDPLLTKRLKEFQTEEELPSFPLTLLNGLKARRNKKPVKWSYEWCKQESDLPEAWLIFAKTLKDNRTHTVDGEINLLRTTLEWAWMERRFPSPSDIIATDLRDSGNPGRTDTLYAFIRSKTSSHWGLWNQVESSFRVVTLCSPESGIIQEDPFRTINNPFKNSKKRSGYTTTRTRIPNNIHAAMLHTLLSPDENGIPTYSLAKEILKNDWIVQFNPETKMNEWIFSPSRTNLLALLLILPLRKKQASWLDQGLLDPYIWDIDEKKYVSNSHKLKDRKYPSGTTHLSFNGRPTGVLQPIVNDWFSDNTYCIYVNTNKTQMWDPDNKRGYELWWPTGDLLNPDIDIADLTQQKQYLNRPYEIIEAQIKWIQQYDPNPEPITFIDWSSERLNKRMENDKELPFFTPIFRDLSTPYYRENGTPYFVPPTKMKLSYLLNAIAVHTEKQLKEEYGMDVSLTRSHIGEHAGSSFHNRVCLYDIHSFRVYGVSYLMEIGVPWPIVQMIVGHTTPVMTLYYNKMTSDFVHKIMSSQVRKSDYFSNFNEIAEDILKNNTQFITRNKQSNSVSGSDQEEEYRGFVSRPGGICPVGGLECQQGQVSIINDSIQYTSTEGRCGNCRFFCTTPAHLFQHQQVINDLFIQIRSLGKKQSFIANEIKALHFSQDASFENQSRLQELMAQLESLESETEPLVREWMNRREMATRSAEMLEPFVEYLKKHPQASAGKSMLLISPGTKDDLESRIEFHFQKAGEFELVRQSMLGAHFSGGVYQCSELTRYQMRDFLNNIMAHDNPQQLLFTIPDDAARDKVALLMAEAMVSCVGTESIQNAIDNRTGLRAGMLNESDYVRLEDFLNEVFNKAINQGASFSIETLLPEFLALTAQDGGKNVLS
ncbi:putative integrase [Buttiauxella sp. JUb87]|uniref:VPA1269 family protein n=1 Tax=Buttiauxella sp. JUb87 TaxID=2485129 RepID=UPI00105F31AF|nr:VPA1269 family protein [Buttiauxella sp. JUb87]TDN50113.1 putative integrase [Buttiauxella sp. JUb87]